MSRRRALIGDEEKIDIELDTNFFSSSDPDYIDGQYITGASVGTKNYTFSSWSVYGTSGFMPYDSRCIFVTTKLTSSNSKLLVLSEDKTVMYYTADGSYINGSAGQERIQAKEAELGIKAKYVRISTTAKSSATYKRTA